MMAGRPKRRRGWRTSSGSKRSKFSLPRFLLSPEILRIAQDRSGYPQKGEPAPFSLFLLSADDSVEEKKQNENNDSLLGRDPSVGGICLRAGITKNERSDPVRISRGQFGASFGRLHGRYGRGAWSGAVEVSRWQVERDDH